MIRILHIVENYSLSGGGIRTVVKNLVEELSQINFKSFVLTSLKEDEDKNIYVVKTSKSWLYSKEWKIKIKEICSKNKIDCIHIHGTWMYPQFIAAKFSLENKIPFILSPHGMYEPWLWQKGTLKKKMYFNLLTKRIFTKAAVLHAITKNEEKNLKEIFVRPNIVEIPNLIKCNKELNEVFSSNERYILYLGRLNRIKGIDLLIKSFIKIKPKGVKLKIAGEFNPYKKELEKIVLDANVNNIEFVGFVSGKVKDNLIKNAFVIATPSHSEVIGMVNLEAAILKTPVITTFQTGLSTSWRENGGFLINPNEEELMQSLKKVLKWTNEERKENGQKLYDFVVKNYTWQNRIEDWKNLYKSAING